MLVWIHSVLPLSQTKKVFTVSLIQEGLYLTGLKSCFWCFILLISFETPSFEASFLVSLFKNLDLCIGTGILIRNCLEAVVSKLTLCNEREKRGQWL